MPPNLVGDAELDGMAEYIHGLKNSRKKWLDDSEKRHFSHFLFVNGGFDFSSYSTLRII